MLVGAGVGSGVATAPAFVLATQLVSAGGSKNASLVHVLATFDKVAEQLKLRSIDESADILIALAGILKDPVLRQTVKDFMAEGSGAVRAVRGAFAKFARDFEKLGGYFAERAQDLSDLAEQVVAELNGGAEAANFPDQPFVLVVENLSPMLANELTTTAAVAVITEKGSATSHSAIITKASGLPTVMGVVGALELESGQELLIDATSGQVFVEPNEEDRAHYAEAAEPGTRVLQVLPDLSDLPVALLANVGSSLEAGNVLRSGSRGIGLFRTELLYLGRTEPPTRAEQVFEYSKLFARMSGKRVVVRVLDLDSDKPLPFLSPAGTGRYANRGLQVLLANRQVLVDQLEALAMAHSYYPEAKLWVMAPMVLNAEQALEFVGLARAVGLTRVGIMVEVPELCDAKVLKQILPEIDFVSIGTNDLTQYVLGKSRHDSDLALSQARSPQVLSAIKTVVAACQKARKPVGICGEAASDPDSAKLFVKLGVESLSASPALIPQLAAELLDSGKVKRRWLPKA